MKTLENWSITTEDEVPVIRGEINGEETVCGLYLSREDNIVHTETGAFLLGKESVDQSIAEAMDELEKM